MQDVIPLAPEVRVPKSRLLIVDDDQGMRENLAELFESLGYAGLTAANTPAALTLPHTWFDLVRTGGGIFGLSTLPGWPPGWLRPAMTVRARLVQVKQVAAGTGVSTSVSSKWPGEPYERRTKAFMIFLSAVPQTALRCKTYCAR